MPQSGISGSLNRTARQVDALARVWSSIRERRCALDRELKLKLRPIVTAWVRERLDDAEEIAPQSGQRFVFRTVDRAVKLFPPLNEDERERCRREVSFLSEEPIEGLPTVLTELQDIEIDGYTFSVYEEAWIDADSIKETVENGSYGLDQAMAVLQQGSRILRDLHSRNVVHRDVSHGNVLIGEGQVSIVDLGLAKYLDLDSLTRTSEHLKMTLAFASPEQITGGSSVLGPATDVYSLALVAVFASTGQYAYQPQGEAFVLDDYLARMAHRDLIVDVSDLPAIVHSMVDPIASFRPKAADVYRELQ